MRRDIDASPSSSGVAIAHQRDQSGSHSPLSSTYAFAPAGRVDSLAMRTWSASAPRPWAVNGERRSHINRRDLIVPPYGDREPRTRASPIPVPLVRGLRVRNAVEPVEDPGDAWRDADRCRISRTTALSNRRESHTGSPVERASNYWRRFKTIFPHVAVDVHRRKPWVARPRPIEARPLDDGTGSWTLPRCGYVRRLVRFASSRPPDERSRAAYSRA